MEWPKLLSFRRHGDTKPREFDPSRPPWQVDYDRVVFSSPFRRLQGKTQVFPLSDSDYVRTRLTHSLEVSTVARTLGTRVGKKILDEHGAQPYLPGKTLGEVLTPGDIGLITATGALAHDIGNPPLGHSGEKAIRHWFTTSPVAANIRSQLEPSMRTDFEEWEGNAEGFRIISRLHLYRDKGGMKLTAATLGAFAKYPTASAATLTGEAAKTCVGAKKHGFFVNDRNLWEEAANELGLIKDGAADRWCRHPLAYLTEAADDICYTIIDLEDGHRQGSVSYEEVEELFTGVIGKEKAERVKTLPEWDKSGKVSYFRARAINYVIDQVVDAFLANEERILAGKFEGALLESTECGASMATIKEIATRKVFGARNILEIEAAGYEIIPGLLDAFANAVENVHDSESGRAARCLKSEKLLQLMPREFLGENAKPSEDPYVRLLGVIDFVAGMTDLYALGLYRKLKGVSL